ncbi:MAG: ATP-binding protein, partial [Acidobacteriota bacterium]
FARGGAMDGDGLMRPKAQELLKNDLLDARRHKDEMAHTLGIIQRFTELLPQKLGVRGTCARLVRIVIEETGFENCSISLWDPELGCLVLAAAYGLPDLLEEGISGPYHKELRFDSGREVAVRVFKSRKPLFVENTEEEPIPEKEGAVVRPGALCCLPVLHLGVINLSVQKPRGFSPEERRHWMILANTVGQLVLTASFQERLIDANQNLQYEIDEKTRELEAGNRDLAASKRLLERIFDGVPQGICLLDTRGRVVRTNRGMESIRGMADCVECSPSLFFKSPELFDSLVEEADRRGRAVRNDVALIDTAGRIHSVDVFMARLNDRVAEGYLLVLNDVTEQKAFSEQILRTEKLAALGTMAGGVAHDFNNLLMTVLGNTQLLLLQTEEGQTRNRLKNIEMAVQDAAHALRRLQTFTVCGREPHSSGCVCDVNEVLRDALELTRHQWKSAVERYGCTIDLRMELDPDCTASIHASDLREVLTNLILNGVDAMPGGGTLTLASRCQDNDVYIEVSDTGAGIAEEVRRKVFDPFFTTKGMGNSGLGLSVSWNLVNRYGGDISVSSRPDRGSVFCIRLPRGSVGEDAQSPSAPEPERRSCRLLLVDDDVEVLRLLRDMIRLSGHRVVAVSDGREAMELIDRESFDLVMTDLGMPMISGWELAKHSKSRNPQTPVVLVTGWDVQGEGEDLQSQGVDMVLQKPLSREKLQEVIQGLTGGGCTFEVK